MNSIFHRISVRKYEDKPVEKEKIMEILKAGMQAPSACNQQPWEFYVVTDKEKIQKLSKVTPYTGCAAGAPAVIVPVYHTGKKPMQKEFPTEQLTYGLFGKKRAKCRFFYRNAHKTRILFRENLILPRQDTSRQETNHWNLHFGN